MQATVHRYDADGGGSVLLDDGRRLAFAPQALTHSGLRLLRPGQRVSVELAGDDHAVSRVWIEGVRD